MDISNSYIYLIIVLATVILVQKLTGYSIITFVEDIANKIAEILLLLSGRAYIKNKAKFTKFNQQEKKKNKSYQYFSFLNGILLDIGWKTKGITVEGFNITLQFISLICVIIASFGIKNIFLLFILWVTTYVLSIAIMFLVSRRSHIYRKNALMDAEDLICTNMSNGIVVAVEGAIDSMDALVKPIFSEFLDEIYNRNVDVYIAIDHLNVNCGEQFDTFCDKTKSYERERRPGMENVFQYNITRNAFVRLLDKRALHSFNAMNTNYMLCVLIIAAFLAFNLFSYSAMLSFYLSPNGRMLLLLYFVELSIAFIYIQYLQSLPFVYGKLKNRKKSNEAAKNFQTNGESTSKFILKTKKLLSFKGRKNK